MDHELAVLVPVDLDGACGRTAVTGCPTEDDQHVLYPLVRRPRTPVPEGLPAHGHIPPPATRPPEASGRAGWTGPQRLPRPLRGTTAQPGPMHEAAGTIPDERDK